MRKRDVATELYTIVRNFASKGSRAPTQFDEYQSFRRAMDFLPKIGNPEEFFRRQPRVGGFVDRNFFINFVNGLNMYRQLEALAQTYQERKGRGEDLTNAEVIQGRDWQATISGLFDVDRQIMRNNRQIRDLWGRLNQAA